LFRTGGEALDFLYKRGPFSRAPQPDVVLLDLFLPDLDGVAVLREMRTDGQLRQIPVVVLTSSDDGSDKRECELLGVSSYIRKPFSEDKFLSVIKRMHGLSISNAVAN
jgi:two-component system response regulator